MGIDLSLNTNKNDLNKISRKLSDFVLYRAFSHVRLFSYVSTFFCFNKFAWLLATWVETLHSMNYILKGENSVLKIIEFTD